MQRVILVFLILIACNQGPTANTKTEDENEETKNWPPSIPFFSQAFNQVVLYYLDPKYYQNDFSEELESKIMNAPYTNGLSFIDSLGKPNTKFYKQRILSGEESKEIISILKVNTESNSMTSCIPIYRDVIVFLNHSKQVAQAQICFECNQIYFTPDPNYLFDERNWKELSNTIEKIKSH